MVGYDGEFVGVWVQANDREFRVRLRDGRATGLRSDAIADTNEAVVTLICYASGIAGRRESQAAREVWGHLVPSALA